VTLRRAPLLGVGAALLAAGSTACSDLGTDVMGRIQELADHRQLWQATRPAAYVYAVERLCFCALAGPVRVTVSDGAVTERVYVESGELVPEQQGDLYPTVDGLFDLLANAMGTGAHEVTVTYDEATGVPTDFWIDYQENVADEELGMRVTEPVSPTDAGT